jgi:L-2,4-diaminobutyrate transaminase
VAKGLTSGYVPMSAVLIGEKVASALERAGALGPFSHGYTYSGHPLGAAAANAALDIVERENLVGNAGAVGTRMLAELRQALADIPMVGEVRGEGLLMAVEFVRDAKKKLRFETALGVGARVSKECLADGLIARAMPHGDILGLAPPLVLTAADASEIVRLCRNAILRVYAQVKDAA